MSLILNIETSGTTCSVCLAKNGQMLDYREDQQGNSHARVLTVFIDDLLNKNNIGFKALDAIAVSSGPGSYTGLRIGTSVAKGLCYATDKPLIAVPTLFSLAHAMMKTTDCAQGFYMPVIDARRMDVYTTLFDTKGAEVLKGQRVTVGAQFEETLNSFGEIYLGGNAINKCREVFTSHKFHFIDGIDVNCRWMIEIAEQKCKHVDFEDLAYFEPTYINEFGAKN